MSSNPNSQYFSGNSGESSQPQTFRSALTHTPAPSFGGGGGGAVPGASEQSVGVAPRAWPLRLFGHPAAPAVGPPAQNEPDTMSVEGLRESSVIVRPMAPPLSDAAITPRIGLTASPQRSPPRRSPQRENPYKSPNKSPNRAGASPDRGIWMPRHPSDAAPEVATAPPHTAMDSGWYGSRAAAQAQVQGQPQQQDGHAAMFRPPSAASMQHFPSSQQQQQQHVYQDEADGFRYIATPAAAAVGPQLDGKSSPTKSIDASAFHLDAYAGATAAVEAAAAAVGGKSQTGGRPSRTAALRQRHLKQLRQQNRDQFGVPVASTARPFSLWASPQKIGEACTGLGVYFASVKQFVIVALLLSLVAIYPLVSNLVSQNWAGSYKLVVDKVPLLSCSKGWDTNSWVTGTTAGSRCSSTRYSSSYDCPAVCTWSEARLDDKQCRGLPPPSLPASATGDNATCLLYPPCSSTSGSSDPAAPDGPCYCCELQLDAAAVAAAAGKKGKSSAGSVPPAQLWVLFLGQLLYLFWMLFLTRHQLKAVHQADARVVSASDYTAIIHGVPPGVTDAQLREWCSHYGSLVAGYNIPDAGDAIRIAQHLQLLLVRKAESDAWLGSNAARWRAWWFGLFAMGASGRLQLQRQLEDAAHKLCCYERQELRPTGSALVVFEYAEHAANCIEDHHRPALRRLLDSALCGATDTAPRMMARRVRVRRAPEPSDILWQHTACTGSAAFTRRLGSWVLTLLIMAAGAGVQYGLAVAAEEERKNRLSALYRYGDAADGTLDFSSWAAFTASALQVTKLNAISIVSGLAVVVVNWLVTVAVRKLTVMERWHTRTAAERWSLMKLSVSYLMNAFVVPLLAAYFAGSSSSWYSRGGLMESAFFMQVANAVLPPIAALIDLEDLLYCQLVSRSAKTQAMMNRLLQPPEFLLAEQYASALTTLGVAMFWMPLLPISPFIAAAGLFLAYWADKVVALRRAANPGNMRGKLVSGAAAFIRALPLVQLVLMRFLYFRDEGSMKAVFWAGLAVWLAFAIAPIRRMLGLVPRRRSTVTGGLSFHETLGGGQRQGLDDSYSAEVPPCCSEPYRKQVEAVFELLPEPQPANEALLSRQNPATGGSATRPPYRPDRVADRAVALAAASLRARQQAALGRAASGEHPADSGEVASGSGGSQQHQGQHVQQQHHAVGSRLAHSLNAVKDSITEGVSWLWNAPDPDNLFSYDWRHSEASGSQAPRVPPLASHPPLV